MLTFKKCFKKSKFYLKRLKKKIEKIKIKNFNTNSKNLINNNKRKNLL